MCILWMVVLWPWLKCVLRDGDNTAHTASGGVLLHWHALLYNRMTIWKHNAVCFHSYETTKRQNVSIASTSKDACSNDLQHQFKLNHELLKATVHSATFKNTIVISEINDVNHRWLKPLAEKHVLIRLKERGEDFRAGRIKPTSLFPALLLLRPVNPIFTKLII